MKVSIELRPLFFLLFAAIFLEVPLAASQSETTETLTETQAETPDSQPQETGTTSSSTDPASTNETAESQDNQSTAQQNFEMGVVAFSRGLCPDAIPFLSNAVSDDTSTDDLVLITQMLAACLANTGDIGRARVLMQQILPLIRAEKGAESIDYLNHNITWAEFELMVGERINAANRLTDGLINYLSGKEVDVDEAYRALAAYATVMVAQNEIERFLKDIETLKASDSQVAWSGDETLGQKIDALPPLDGTPTNLAVWALMAMEEMPGVKTFQDLLGAVIRGEGKAAQ